MRSAAYCCVYATENYIKPTYNWERNSFPACDKDRMRMRYTILCTAWDGNTHCHGIVCFILKCFFLFYFSLLSALRLPFCFFFFSSVFFIFFSALRFIFSHFLLPILILCNASRVYMYGFGEYIRVCVSLDMCVQRMVRLFIFCAPCYYRMRACNALSASYTIKYCVCTE